MKKAMRKSALLSSVAMLIVSAIVLTSATYAWFSASKTAEVKDITADVEATTGLLINVGSGWGNKFTEDDVENGVPGVFAPVSSSTGATWVTGDYEDGDLTLEPATPGTNGQFVSFPVKVTGPANKDVNVAVTLGGSNQAKKVLKFALVPKGKTLQDSKVLLGDTADDDTSHFGTSATGVVANTGDGAFTVNTTGDANAKKVESTSTISAFNLGSATRDNPVEFTAYLWIEGNDPDCDGSLFGDEENISFSITFTLAE